MFIYKSSSKIFSFYDNNFGVQLKFFALILLISSLVFAKPIIIYEVDTGISLSHLPIRNHINIANWEKEDYIDTNFHGTHIAGLILKDVCAQVEIVSCKYYFNDGKEFQNTIACFKNALKVKPNIINYSSGGAQKSDEEFSILKQLSDLGIKIVVAAGNDGLNLSLPNNNYYPAKYKGIKNLIVVGNFNSNSSNYGIPGMFWELGTNIYSYFPNGRFGYMTGSSQSAAKYSNKLLKRLCDEDNKN